MAMMMFSVALATVARAMAHGTAQTLPSVAAPGSSGATVVDLGLSDWSIIPGADDAEGAACAGTRNPCILNGTLGSVGECQEV